MTSAALTVQGLGKRYRIGTRAVSSATAGEGLIRLLTAPWRRLRHLSTSGLNGTELWALRDVSFELERGKALGIIGRNGAGKSTLLKILSRITRPTEGQATVRGRVGSLLEIGTGFHPELTGRENIFLNGAVLGMTRMEIKQRFEEIVDFSGVEKFLDTPVKYYSTGMHTRLAFAVAAHLEPDVLIVDEVLAVGDAEFQMKCLGKMSRVAGEGRTVIFVSHDLVAVEHLCQRVLLFDQGRVLCDDVPSKVLDAYRNELNESATSVDLSFSSGRVQCMKPVLRRVDLLDESGNPSSSVECGKPLFVELSYQYVAEVRSPAFALLLTTSDGRKLFHLASEMTSELPGSAAARGKAVCCIDSVPLVPGRYGLTLGCRAGAEQLDLVENACWFDVTAANFYGTGRLPTAGNGPFLVHGSWTVEEG